MDDTDEDWKMILRWLLKKWALVVFIVLNVSGIGLWLDFIFMSLNP
jgi:hypothetical protein